MQWNLLESAGQGHAERISRLKIPKGPHFRRCAVRRKRPNLSNIEQSYRFLHHDAEERRHFYEHLLPRIADVRLPDAVQGGIYVYDARAVCRCLILQRGCREPGAVIEPKLAAPGASLVLQRAAYVERHGSRHAAGIVDFSKELFRV